MQRGAGPRDDVVGEGDVLGDVDLPAGVDQPDHYPCDVGGESRQVGFGADGRERLAIDLRRIADVVEHVLTLVGSVSVAGRQQHLTGRRAAAGAFAADEVTMHRRNPSSSDPRRVRPHVGGRLCAAGAAGAGADVQPGGVLVEHQAQRRQHPQRDFGDPSSRSQTSTERHGVITSGASIAARNSATRAGSTPSGTAAPSATRPSS